VPIYDFKCRECGIVSEVFLRGECSAVSPCPSCGSSNLEKLFSASYTVRMGTKSTGDTCCGRAERCDAPPCNTDHGCHRR
jgi:putative FmdB family regulatory protein